MAAADPERRQKMSNMLLILVLFNLVFLFFSYQKQKELQKTTQAKHVPSRTSTRELVRDIAREASVSEDTVWSVISEAPSIDEKTKNNIFIAWQRVAIDVQSIDKGRAKEEALQLIKASREFEGSNYGAFALLRLSVIVAEKLDAKTAAEVYNLAIPPRNEAAAVATIEPRKAASEIANLIVHKYSHSPFAAQGAFFHAQFLTPSEASQIDATAVNAWESARSNKTLAYQTVYVREGSAIVATTIDSRSCLYLDPYYSDGTMYRILDTLVSVTGRNPSYSHALALILFALSVRILLYPLTKVQMKSFKAMADLAPRMKEIQDKYKDNKDRERLQKMNAEIHAEYKKAGANPALGCVLAIVQLPFFILMYRAVGHYQCQFNCPTMKMSLACPPGPHASFLWIPNLARPDNLLLGLYVISMLIQGMTMQRPSADPQQQATQKMTTYFMPLFFAYMMFQWQFPSAFVIYWLTFNLISIFQQVKTMYTSDELSFKTHGVQGVVRRLVSPSLSQQSTPQNSGSKPAIDSTNGQEITPRPRRGNRRRRDGKKKERRTSGGGGDVDVRR